MTLSTGEPTRNACMTKPFCFTYSKLKSFETCGLQYQHQDILKTPGTEPQGDFIDWGNDVHEAIENALNHRLQTGKKEAKPLPPRMQHLQYWVDYCANLPGDAKYVEEKWALNKDRMAAPYFSPPPWYRLKVDFASVDRATKSGVLVDWKSGNRLDEPLQLWLGAACMFMQFPPEELDLIVSMFVWLKEFDPKQISEDTLERWTSVEVIKRSQIDDIWDSLGHRIDALESAVADNVFHPKPGRHCRWCRVTACDFRGKGQ